MKKLRASLGRRQASRQNEMMKNEMLPRSYLGEPCSASGKRNQGFIGLEAGGAAPEWQAAHSRRPQKTHTCMTTAHTGAANARLPVSLRSRRPRC
jgi:hypothetical protein